MFNEIEFKSFIKSKVNLKYKPRKYSIDEYITSVAQQYTYGYKFLNYKIAGNYSRDIRNIFKNSIENKPSSSSINKYFLYLFGYIKCNCCDNIKELKEFNIDNSRWNNLDSTCRICKNSNNKKWREENLEKVSIMETKKNIILQNAITNFTDFEEKAKCIKLRKLCESLLKKECQLDHIIPLSKNGKDDKYSWQILTKYDNGRKQNRLEETIIPKIDPIVSNNELILYLDTNIRPKILKDL